MARTTMMRTRVDGGWAVPDYEQYYLAAQLQWLTQAVAREFRGPDTMEDLWIPRHVLAFIVLGQRLRPHSLTREERALQQCWSRSHKRHGVLRPYAPEIPLGACTALPHGGDWSALGSWEEKGLQMIGDLYEDGVMLPFQELRDRYDLPRGDYLLHLQLRSRLGEGVDWRNLPRHPHVNMWLWLRGHTRLLHVLTDAWDLRVGNHCYILKANGRRI